MWTAFPGQLSGWPEITVIFGINLLLQSTLIILIGLAGAYVLGKATQGSGGAVASSAHMSGRRTPRSPGAPRLLRNGSERAACNRPDTERSRCLRAGRNLFPNVSRHRPLQTGEKRWRPWRRSPGLPGPRRHAPLFRQRFPRRIRSLPRAETTVGHSGQYPLCGGCPTPPESPKRAFFTMACHGDFAFPFILVWAAFSLFLTLRTVAITLHPSYPPPVFSRAPPIMRTCADRRRCNWNACATHSAEPVCNQHTAHRLLPPGDSSPPRRERTVQWPPARYFFTNSPHLERRDPPLAPPVANSRKFYSPSSRSCGRLPSHRGTERLCERRFVIRHTGWQRVYAAPAFRSCPLISPRRDRDRGERGHPFHPFIRSCGESNISSTIPIPAISR